MDTKINTPFHLKSELVAQFKELGIKPGDTLMLHASVRAVGTVLGGPDELLQALFNVLTEKGTAMMYVGCDPVYESVGNNNYNTLEEAIILNNCPAFEPQKTRARRDYGILAEFFRSSPGVVCSENPGARMAAFGAQANRLIANHSLNYGYGPDSPLAGLYKNEGKIVLLGSDLDQVTLLHYAEHITPVSEKRTKHFKVPVLENGSRFWREIEEFDTSMGIRQWPDRFFASIVERYLEENNIQAVKVGNADSYLLEAKKLVDFAVPIFIEAADKYS
jgi:aminoglycoside 3-N-acetyltransferase